MVLCRTCGPTSDPKVGQFLVRDLSSENEFLGCFGNGLIKFFWRNLPPAGNLVLSFDRHYCSTMHSNSCWASFLGDFATEMKTTEKGDYKKASTKWLFHRPRLIRFWSLIRLLVFANFRPRQHSLEPWKCFPNCWDARKYETSMAFDVWWDLPKKRSLQKSSLAKLVTFSWL